MIKIEKKEGVAVVTINNPDQLNALSFNDLKELDTILVKLNKDKEIKSIIITGSGKSFISGGNLKEMVGLKGRRLLEFVSAGKKVVETIINSDKVLIAAVNGYALGAGCEICEACDIVIASKEAKFGQPEVKLGIIPGFGGSVLLPKIVGRKSKEMIFRGNIISADEAYRIGLANYIVDDALQFSLDIADEIAENSGNAIALAKKIINKDLVKEFKLETKYFVKSFKSKDRVEGIKAFLEKRKPRFK